MNKMPCLVTYVLGWLEPPNLLLRGESTNEYTTALPNIVTQRTLSKHVARNNENMRVYFRCVFLLSSHQERVKPWPRYKNNNSTKFIHKKSNFPINNNYHGDLASQLIKIKDSMKILMLMAKLPLILNFMQ